MIENKSVNTLHELLDDNIRRFIVAETELQNVLPYLIQTASNIALKNVLQKYQDMVKMHVHKMEDFFEEESITYLSASNKVMHAFLSETEERVSQCVDFATKDACLLSCIQNINHFKIGTYGTAAAFANALEMNKTAVIFHEFEINEKQIDDRLSQLAEFEINKKAKTRIGIA
jgi:ferritin-like metal-binding protein YciE